MVDVRSEDECWPWTGHLNHGGYGEITMPAELGERRGKKKRAHVYAWERENGPVPEGKIIMHECDNPPCCNERHLKLGTHKLNAEDRDAKGRGYFHFRDGRA